MPLGSPDHLTLESYVQYLEDYVSHFKLDKEIDFRLSTKVIKIERGGEKEGGHWVTSQRNSSELERSEHFTHLSICSGLHVTPAVFEIPGLPSPLTTKEEVNERAAAIEEEKNPELRLPVLQSYHFTLVLTLPLQFSRKNQY